MGGYFVFERLSKFGLVRPPHREAATRNLSHLADILLDGHWCLHASIILYVLAWIIAVKEESKLMAASPVPKFSVESFFIGAISKSQRHQDQGLSLGFKKAGLTLDIGQLKRVEWALDFI